ncbi:relaxase MobL [Niameybacter massiliensis]|uniref:Relaxase MobL n=1 Tax=Holtiella tumoricola TaxID=3018743 RepID=A0AA42J0F9_9FIRM|nr:MobP3 family relaxase [Holtiella tumoricola]MDA3731360.1 relaxase MobL [Holtiella tumoricola]
MPRVIFKCPYLKSGDTAHKENLVSYIATRDGVQKMVIRNKNLPATKKQEQLITQILNEFPDTKNLFEYEDYLENKTLENASEFITNALEHNLDVVVKKENYVDYIANRPRVEKISSHGLFNGGSDKIILSKVAKEVSEHEGNVWLPIISLRREEAIRTEFDNAERWKDYLSSYAPTIAESLKIPLEEFRWYAAFHDENHHPHIHMICYCENARHGFLDKKGIAKIKSGLVSGIFKQEMIAIYAEQTKRRDTLKAESKKVIEQLFMKISAGEMQTAAIEKMLAELSENLECTQGKRVYGYLPPRTKKLVDDITDELAKEPSIAHAYKLWCEMRSEITASYRDTPEPIFPLSQQKEFKSIKNHIIYEADRLAKGEIILTEIDEMEQLDESSVQEETIADSSFLEPIDTEEEIGMEENNSPYVKWTEEYKQARVFLFGDADHEPDFECALELLQAESQNGNMLAVFDLGRMYADGLGMEIDTEKAQRYYKQALDGLLFLENKKPCKYLEYRIGKMYAQGHGTEQDYELAAEWFQKSAKENYKYAEYSLGGLFYRGQGVEQSYEKAFELYLRSAKQGFPYAYFEVAKMFRDGIGTEKDKEQSTHHFEKAYLGFVALEKQNHDDKIQYRLGWILQNGIGTEKDVPKAKEYFEKSAKLGNPFACYSLAKLILTEDNLTTEELQTALKYLQTASDSGNELAQYSLAKLYYKGEHLEHNLTKAVELFSLSAEQGNEWAAYSLGKIYLNEESCRDIQKAVNWLSQSAEKQNQFSQYQLGKLYLAGEQIPKDTQKAVFYLSASVEQGNQFAGYILGKLYLMGKDVPKDKETAIKWFTLSAEQGNEYAQFFLDNIDRWKELSVSFAVTRLMHHMSQIFENNQPSQKSVVSLKIDSKRMRKLREKKLAQGHKQDDHEQRLEY